MVTLQVWMTLPFATVLAKPHVSTAAHLLEACQQAGVIGCFAGLSNNMTCQALVKCANRKFCHQTVTAGHVSVWLALQETNHTGHRQRPYFCGPCSTMRQPW